MDNVLYTAYLAIGLVIGLPIHEFAHAFVAVRLGDDSPRRMGRLTLNPRAHVDPFGSLLLPAILLLPVLFGRFLFPIFAYAKPMALDPWNLRKPDRDTVLIALAGPVASVLVALVFGGLLRGIGAIGGQLTRLLAACLQVNVILGAMNLVPLPPFDGFRVVARFLPPRARETYLGWEHYAPLIVIVIFFLLPFAVFPFVDAIANGICRVAVGAACVG